MKHWELFAFGFLSALEQHLQVWAIMLLASLHAHTSMLVCEKAFPLPSKALIGTFICSNCGALHASGRCCQQMGAVNFVMGQGKV